MPAARNVGDRRRAVLAAHQGQARRLDEPLVDARRDEQVKADRVPYLDLAFRDRAGEDEDIGEDHPTAASEDAGPFRQGARAVVQVRDRIDAERRVEGGVLERQGSAAVAHGERRPACQPAGGCLGAGIGNPIGLDIQADQPASGALDQGQAGPP